MSQQQSEMPAAFASSADDVIFTRLSWVYTNDEGRALFLESPKRIKLFEPGGKRVLGLSDEEALAQKILQDLEVTLIEETIRFLFSFKAQAHGMPDDTMMETRCYSADFAGFLRPTKRVTSLHWLGTSKKHLTTESGSMYLQRLFYAGLVG